MFRQDESESTPRATLIGASHIGEVHIAASFPMDLVMILLAS